MIQSEKNIVNKTNFIMFNNKKQPRTDVHIVLNV